ncbi:hypothetical protein J2Y69_003524 [Microbacterium resistens]|uniref:Uncharacterized protein n=1 Tax=Microbacterium resistens TaxID=156977 RepID=A0ABU1SIS5_9MICO|nr:hypothetical protein [Microbacterium resistens]
MLRAWTATRSRWTSTAVSEASGPVPEEPRQRIVRVGGARRARLTPAPGTHAEPDERDRTSAMPAVPDPSAGFGGSEASDASGSDGSDGPTGSGRSAGSESGAARRVGPNDERLRREVPPHY